MLTHPATVQQYDYDSGKGDINCIYLKASFEFSLNKLRQTNFCDVCFSHLCFFRVLTSKTCLLSKAWGEIWHMRYMN